MKIELTYEEVQNILESLDIEEIVKRRVGFYPYWNANQKQISPSRFCGWELFSREKEKHEN